MPHKNRVAGPIVHTVADGHTRARCVRKGRTVGAALGAALAVAGLAAAATSCGGSPAAPSSPAPAGDVTISGSERIGWDQPTGSASTAQALTYWMYVDGNRVRLSGSQCSSAADASGFPCSAQLPSLSPGRHVLELSASLDADGTAEGPRSPPITVVVGAASTTSLTLSPRSGAGPAPAVKPARARKQ